MFLFWFIVYPFIYYDINANLAKAAVHYILTTIGTIWIFIILYAIFYIVNDANKLFNTK